MTNAEYKSSPWGKQLKVVNLTLPGLGMQALPANLATNPEGVSSLRQQSEQDSFFLDFYSISLGL